MTFSCGSDKSCLLVSGLFPEVPAGLGSSWGGLAQVPVSGTYKPFGRLYGPQTWCFEVLKRDPGPWLPNLQHSESCCVSASEGSSPAVLDQSCSCNRDFDTSTSKDALLQEVAMLPLGPSGELPDHLPAGHQGCINKASTQWYITIPGPCAAAKCVEHSRRLATHKP